MDIFARYATNPALEQEGKEFDFGGGLKIKIARDGSATYKRMLTQLWEAHKHTLELKDTDDQIKAAEDRSNKIFAKVLAHTVITGWNDKMEYQGKPLPYSVANAEMLLQHKDFQSDIAKKAGDYRNFLISAQEEDEKNLLPSSSGI